MRFRVACVGLVSSAIAFFEFTACDEEWKRYVISIDLGLSTVHHKISRNIVGTRPIKFMIINNPSKLQTTVKLRIQYLKN